MSGHYPRRRKPSKDAQRLPGFDLDSDESIEYTPHKVGETSDVGASLAPNQIREDDSEMTNSNTTIEEISSQPAPRRTYPQNWPAYNAAQTSEKETLLTLLADLVQHVQQPEYTFGRPNYPISDMVYVASLKVYSGFSSRRFDSDVRVAHSEGFIDVPPSFNTVNRYIANPDLTPILTDLIERSAAPLNTVETQFAADASGFSTSRFDRWYDAKWGKEKSQRKWLKAHILTGTLTNTVASISITGSNVHDTVEFPYLLNRASEQFQLEEVSADKAYLSDKNLRHVRKLDGYPYIPFKSNTTGKGSGTWRKMYSYFVLHENEFKEHYHRRSNVETTFSMVKSKFPDSVRAKSETGQVNEILLKFLCHNICVLIQEMHELGISPNLAPIPKLDISLN